jgi:hypothetical protein
MYVLTRTLIGIASIIAIIIGIILLGILVGGINLADYVTQTAVGLTLLGFGILYWTIRPYLARRLDSKIHLSMALKHTKQQESKGTFIKQGGFRLPAEIPQIKQETSTISQPPLIEGKRHYENRSQLPFDEMVYKVERRLEMSAITFRIMTYAYHGVLKRILSRRVHITFLVLNPDSWSTSIQRKIYHGGEDLEDQIQKSLKILCELKKEFNDLVEIKLYDSISQHSIIIIDRDNTDKAWIKVEKRPVGSDSNSRPSDVAYKKDNNGFFTQHLREYDILLGSSKTYECPNSS